MNNDKIDNGISENIRILKKALHEWLRPIKMVRQNLFFFVIGDRIDKFLPQLAGFTPGHDGLDIGVKGA